MCSFLCVYELGHTFSNDGMVLELYPFNHRRGVHVSPDLVFLLKIIFRFKDLFSEASNLYFFQENCLVSEFSYKTCTVDSSSTYLFSLQGYCQKMISEKVLKKRKNLWYSGNVHQKHFYFCRTFSEMNFLILAKKSNITHGKT